MDPIDPNVTPPSVPGTPSAPSPSPYTLAPGMTNQFVNAFYPHWGIQNGQLIGLDASAKDITGSLGDVASRLNALWAPWSQGNYSDFFSALRGTMAPTADSMNSLWPQLTALGFNRPTHAGNQPSDDKLTDPTGSMWDVITDVGGPNAAWGWNKVDGTSGVPVGPLTTPFNEPAPTPWNAPTFTAPTPEEALNDPGYQFRLQQGHDSLQNWAAARGTLNDSGTAKALEDYGQNAASQEYQDVWNRDFNAYGARYNAYQLDYQNAYNRWLQDWNIFRDQRDSTFNKQFQVATA